MLALRNWDSIEYSALLELGDVQLQTAEFISGLKKVIDASNELQRSLAQHPPGATDSAEQPVVTRLRRSRFRCHWQSCTVCIQHKRSATAKAGQPAANAAPSTHAATTQAHFCRIGTRLECC